MSTPNYSFTTIEGDKVIDLPNDINTPLNQIDAALKKVADSSGGSVPTNHASAETTYGIGTASLYGHVKVSDSGSAAASSGTAASPKYVSDQIASLSSQIATLQSTVSDLSDTVEKLTKGTTYNELTANGFVYQSA